MKPSKYPSEAYIVFYRGETGIIEFIDYTTNLKLDAYSKRWVYRIADTTDKNNKKRSIEDRVALGISSYNYKIVKNPIEARAIKALYFGETDA
jgi:hypothetical protein